MEFNGGSPVTCDFTKGRTATRDVQTSLRSGVRIRVYVRSTERKEVEGFGSNILAIVIEGQYLSVSRRNSLSSADKQSESGPLTNHRKYWSRLRVQSKTELSAADI